MQNDVLDRGEGDCRHGSVSKDGPPSGGKASDSTSDNFW
jgi:hypothetical protein